MEKITTASKNQLRLRFIACIYPMAYVLIWPLVYGILPAYSNYYVFGGMYFTLATSMMAWAMYLHRDISENAHTKRVSKLATWNPYSCAGDPGAALGSQEPQRRRPGLGPMGRLGDLGPAACFVAPADPKAATWVSSDFLWWI